MATSASGRQEINLKTLSAGSIVEAIGGAGAVVLAILGLLQIEALFMLSIAAIAAGAGLLFQGSAIAAQYNEMIRQTTTGQMQHMHLGGGLGVEIFTGGTAIGLGILSLVGLIPHILLPITAIVLGCGLAFSSTTISRLNRVKIAYSGISEDVQEIASDAIEAASGTQVLIGLGVAALGILAIIGISAMTLTMIAILASGFSILVTGLSISGRAFTAIKY